MIAYSLVCLLLQAAPGEDAQLRERFDREFSAAVARNKEFYSRMSGSGTMSDMRTTVFSSREEEKAADERGALRVSSDQIGGALAEAYSFSFAVQGALKRYKRTALVKKRLVYRDPDAGVLATKENTRPRRVDDAYAMARCVGRDGSFWVLWKSEGASPTLEDYQAGQKTRIAMRIEVDFVSYIKCIYSCWNLKEEYAFPNACFKIKSVTPRVKDGLNLAHVEFTIEYPGEVPGALVGRYTRGWFDAIPDQGWVIREGAQGSLRTAESVAFKIEYEGSQDGFPLPKRVTDYSNLGRTIAEFDQIRHGSVPESEFTLTAFGLPEIDPKPAPP